MAMLVRRTIRHRQSGEDYSLDVYKYHLVISSSMFKDFTKGYYTTIPELRKAMKPIIESLKNDIVFVRDETDYILFFNNEKDRTWVSMKLPTP